MKETSYLHHLSFTETLRNSFIAKYLANPRLLVLLLIAIIGLGSASFIELPRRFNPEVELPLVIVSTVLPGANPQDVESLITEPIEDEVNGLQKLSKVTSTSSENVSVVSLEFESGVDPDKARADTQAKVDQAELPEDALSSNVQTIDFENQPVWTFALIGKGDVASLNRFSKLLSTDLEALSDIDSVTTGGLEEREISVAINQSQLASYGLNPIQLSTLVKSALSSFPAGQVTTDKSVFSLSIDPTITTLNDVRNLQINIDGNAVPLSSIATITEKSKPNQFPSFFATSEKIAERSINFSVYKTTTADIDDASKNAEKLVEEELAKYDGQFTIRSIINSGEDIDEQFSHLIRDFMFTIVLVFIVLFVFLGARQAIVSLVAVPLTFLISFTVMSMSGISLNFLSMFSLLLSLGLLVDDTIVVISAMSQYYRSGKFTPLQTGLLVWRDFIVAILTTTLTTVFAFLPLLITQGIIGEFIKSIPIVVSATLIASFGVAMLITLPLMIILLKPEIPSRIKTFAKIILVTILLIVFISILPRGPLMILGIITLLVFLFVTSQVRKQLISKSSTYIAQQKKNHETVRNAPRYIENGIISFDKIGERYRRAIHAILESKDARRKAILMVIFFSIFSYLLVPFGFVKNEFFPKSDSNSISLTLELPSGTNGTMTETQGKKLLDEFRNMEDVSFVTATIGQSTGDGFGGGGSSSNSVLYSLVLKDDRKNSSIDLAEEIREKYASYTQGKVTISEGSSGPPAGADLQINLFGEDLAVLDQQAEKIITYLNTQKGVVDVSKSIKSGTSKIVFVPDQALMAQSGVSNEQLGLSLRTFASGFTLDSAKLESGDITSTGKQDITLRIGDSLQSIQDISTITIATQNGSVPLSSLGKLELRPNPTLITREDGKRTISVTAGVSQGFTPTTLNTDLEKFASSDLKLPEGYVWKTGGVNEENQKSVNSILQAMLISFLLIIVTMVIQFGSFRKAVIVMLVIPLSISGVFIIFSLTQTPLSFPALIGVLALFGIVVKNSILIVDKISANEKIGMNFVDAITDGAASRLEPIALTSLAAIMGLIPITISDPLWRGLGGAIIAGLTFSGTIMLFFIPVVYYSWFKNSNSKKRSKAL